MFPIGSHDEFLELCAISIAGSLSEAEQKRLDEHLAGCNACRNARKEFELVVDRTIPAIGAQEHSLNRARDSSWSIEAAEGEFLERLRAEREESQGRSQILSEGATDGNSLAAQDAAWRSAWTLYAAAVLLIVSLGFAAYQLGVHREVPTTKTVSVQAGDQGQRSLEQQLNNATHDRELARADIAERDKRIVDLQRELERRSAELTKAKLIEGELKQDEAVRKSGQNSAHEAELAQKLNTAQLEVQVLRAKLDSLQEQSSHDESRMAGLQAKVDDLTRTLAQKETEVGEQQQLLAHDRDIRELMGARDLYIAEVHDVARSGETQKPFGRVFYTREKSLIFYAYDLDQEVGLKNASTFQAWGRRGPDSSQALNLGIFFQDNAFKKRWVLKFNDPKTLAQIDAVFVTIEPNGGSRKPSGKSLLFAYLKIDPNHP